MHIFGQVYVVLLNANITVERIMESILVLPVSDSPAIKVFFSLFSLEDGQLGHDNTKSVIKL